MPAGAEVASNAEAFAAMGWGADVAAAEGLDGSGVTIAFIDYGFDVLHPCLRRAENGRSRFASLVDQNSVGLDARLDRPQIDRLIASALETGDRGDLDRRYDPHAHYYDRRGAHHGAHGTLMSSIAAGTPHAGFRGLAPEADLIGIQLALPEPGWKEVDTAGQPTWRTWTPAAEPFWRGWRSYVESEAIVAAIDAAEEEACRHGAQALIVNLSIGAWAGAHDGRSAVEKRISELARRNAQSSPPVAAVVLCTGNAGNSEGHFAAHLDPRTPAGLRWIMHKDDPTPNKLEIWYRAGEPISITLAAPTASVGSLARIEIAPGPTIPLIAAGQLIGIADHTPGAQGPLSRARIILHPPYFPKGFWRTGANNAAWQIQCACHEPTAEVELHAWLERDDGIVEQSRLVPSTVASSLSGIACADGAIVAGAFDHATDPSQPIAFPPSGHGPRPWSSGHDCAPHVTAPGTRIWGARSKSDGFAHTSGTSPAAALSSGALALAMDAACRLATGDRSASLARAIALFTGPCTMPPTADYPGLGARPIDISRVIREVRA